MHILVIGIFERSRRATCSWIYVDEGVIFKYYFIVAVP